MVTWVTHLMVADEVTKELSYLCKHEFFVGNIGPDCNVENKDWTSFTPSREITHWMSGKKKVIDDSYRFLREYVEKKENLSEKEELFLLGYFTHLVVDAEYQRYTCDEKRVKDSWNRVKNHSELSKVAVGLDETWGSIKKLINYNERMKDIYSIEKEYLEKNPNSSYLTDVIGLQKFPDYIDYLPKEAIARKIKVMGYMPKKEESCYPYIAISKEEYKEFVATSSKLVIEGIKEYKQYNRHKQYVLSNRKDLK